MPTTRSPGLSVRAMARVKAMVIVVMFAPKQIPSGSAPNNVPNTPRVRSSSASHSFAAAKYPPVLALIPLLANSVIARIAESTICVPAGPSKRAQPPVKPGKRCWISTEDDMVNDDSIKACACWRGQDVWRSCRRAQCCAGQDRPLRCHQQTARGSEAN